jgi:hypothetical protein
MVTLASLGEIMKLRHAAALALALCAPASFAHAGIYTDDLSKCLVKSATPADQSALVLWVYSAMSLHPDIKAYSNMTDDQHEAALKHATEVAERLLTVDCKTETVAALKYEGGSAFEASFTVLGQVAMRNLMTDSNVSKALDVTKYMDKSKFENLEKAAGGSGK